jgi:multiple sugar transport system permease protein
VLVISVIRSFQVFTQIFVSTQGGPLGTTDVLVHYLYVEAFTNFAMGRASAVAYVIFIVIFALTLVPWRAFGRGTEYAT